MISTWRALGRESQNGIALVIVLWGLVLLAVIAASFTMTTRTDTNIARNLVDNAKAEALADAGVYRAILGLLEPVARALARAAPSAPSASTRGEGAGGTRRRKCRGHWGRRAGLKRQSP